MWRRLLRRAGGQWFRTGSQPWALVAVVSGGMLLRKRLTARKEEVVHREVLTPGTTLVISGVSAPTDAT